MIAYDKCTYVGVLEILLAVYVHQFMYIVCLLSRVTCEQSCLVLLCMVQTLGSIIVEF